MTLNAFIKALALGAILIGLFAAIGREIQKFRSLK